MLFWNNSGQTQSSILVNNAVEQIELQRALQQRLQVEKMYHYYKNDTIGINYFLNIFLSKIINAKTLATMQLVSLNYVPRIIKRLSLTYKTAPRRIVNNDTNYNIITSNLSKQFKEFEAQSNLFNTILIRPIWREEYQRFDYLILNSAMCEIETKDNNEWELSKVRYQVETTIKNKKECIWINWTDTEHYATDLSGKRIDVPSIEGNDYKRIPFEILRLRDCADFWGDGMPDIINGNEILNARLTDTFHKLYFSFGIPVGTNLDIKIEDFVLSPANVIMVNNATKDELTPDLKFVTPDQKIELDRAINDWFKNELAGSKGLPTMGIKYNSGFERIVDMMEVLDLNEDNKEVFREFEFRLFDLQKLILEKDSRSIKLTNINLQHIEYASYDFPRTSQEVWFDREKELQYNLINVFDIMKKGNNNLKNDEVKKIIDDNKIINDAYVSTQGLLNNQQKPQQSNLKNILVSKGLL